MNNYLSGMGLVICLFLITVSCQNHNQKTEAVPTKISIEGDTYNVPAESPVIEKIELKTAAAQEVGFEYTTTGTVRTLAGKMVEISSPFEGRIIKSEAKLGAKVKQGTPLFELMSPEFFETVKLYLQARQNKQLAEANYKRKKELNSTGVASSKEFEEATLDLQIAEKELEKNELTLKIFDINVSDPEALKSLIIRSPISGEIIQNNITVGQYLKSDAEPVVKVANLDKVWVVARVKGKNIGLISPQDKVHVVTESLPGETLEGYVDYIGNIMDEQTRSVEVYIECSNEHRKLKPGMFVTVNFEHNLSQAIVIPASALLQQDDDQYIFVQTGKNQYKKRKVQVTSNGEASTIVNEGLSEGDIYVSGGGIYLR